MYTRVMVQFFCETSLPICFLVPGSKFFPGLYNFRTPTQSSWSHLPPTCHAWTYLLSSMPPMQSTWHFHWGNTCILFTLKKKWTSCNAIHVAFLQGHCPVYPRKQVHIQSCYPWNLCSMSKESSCCYPTSRPESNGNKEVTPHSSKHQNWSLTTRYNLVSYQQLS